MKQGDDTWMQSVKWRMPQTCAGSTTSLSAGRMPPGSCFDCDGKDHLAKAKICAAASRRSTNYFVIFLVTKYI